MRDDGPSNVDMNRQKGFTLIELLVVIAIIGLLAAIVLASLNTARAKGANAAVKANLSNARAQAEVYYDTPANYGTVTSDSYSATGASADTCVLAGTIFGTASTNSINPNIVAAQNAGGGLAVCSYDASTVAGIGWAVATPLKVAENGMAAWCVDSTGASKAVSTAAGALTGAGDVTC